MIGGQAEGKGWGYRLKGVNYEGSGLWLASRLGLGLGLGCGLGVRVRVRYVCRGRGCSVVLNVHSGQ